MWIEQRQTSMYSEASWFLPMERWSTNHWYPKLTKHLAKTRPNHLYTRVARPDETGDRPTVIRRRRKLLPCVVTS